MNEYIEHRLHRLLSLALRKRLVVDADGEPLRVLDVTTDGMLSVAREGARAREGSFLVEPFAVDPYE